MSPKFCCADERSPRAVFARTQGAHAPPDRPLGRALLQRHQQDYGQRALSHKVPRTSVAAPSRRSDAALSWVLLDVRKGLEVDIWYKHNRGPRPTSGWRAEAGSKHFIFQPLPPTFCWQPLQSALPGGGRARPGGATRLESGPRRNLERPQSARTGFRCATFQNQNRAKTGLSLLSVLGSTAPPIDMSC